MGEDQAKGIRHLIHTRVADADTKLSGLLVQVTYFNTTQTVRNNSITLFALDALAGTIREIFVSFYLALDVAATFTPGWYVTRAGDLITFTAQAVPALAAIATPAANAYYSYSLGDLAWGLQGEFRLAQDNAGAANVLVDAYMTVLMEL